MININDAIIKEERYIECMNTSVKPYIDERKTDGFFEGYDGKSLHYVAFKANNERGTVVVLHGFTESCEKYDEMIYYFLKSGLSVYLCEHRGHGLSYRKTCDFTLTHIDHFSEYTDDLEYFVDSVVQKSAKRPLYLYAHSMGGAVGMLYMIKHPDTFERAVLSSPMIVPASKGVPLWLGRLITGVFVRLGKGEKMLFAAKGYSDSKLLESSCATSPERFKYYDMKRSANTSLKSFFPTYSWSYEALMVSKSILRKGAPEGIRTKICMFSASCDTVVKRAPQKKLCRRLGIRLEVIQGAKHEIFSSHDDVMAVYLKELLEFFD